MNETIKLKRRQKAIITLLSDGRPYSRKTIAENISPLFPASKATLARDLAELVEQKYIQVVGFGPRTLYQAIATHPLLMPLDLNAYFSETNESKRQSVNFDSRIFTQFRNIFSSSEIKRLNTNSRLLDQTINKLDSTVVERELERFLIEFSWKSSQIEGNTYSLLETETLIKQHIEAVGKTKEEAAMILNHKDAFKMIWQNRSEFKTIQTSLITQLHQILTQKLGIHPGLRQHVIGITGSYYHPPDNQWQLQEYLDQLIELVNNLTFPLEKALAILSLLAKLQVFADGNKRTARMLANAVLLSYDIFPISYRSIDINEYKQALIVFYETDNLFHLKRLFLEQHIYAQTNYFS